MASGPVTQEKKEKSALSAGTARRTQAARAFISLVTHAHGRKQLNKKVRDSLVKPFFPYISYSVTLKGKMLLFSLLKAHGASSMGFSTTCLLRASPLYLTLATQDYWLLSTGSFLLASTNVGLTKFSG